MSHSVDPQVDIINPVNGDITGTFLCVSGIAVMPGTGADAVLMAPSTALLLKLQTAPTWTGRRLQGRGYISPVRRATADDNGTPTPQRSLRSRSWATTCATAAQTRSWWSGGDHGRQTRL